MHRSEVNIREAAVWILYQYQTTKNLFISRCLKKYLTTHSIKSQDKSLLYQIVLGVVQNKTYLDYYIENVSNFELSKISLKLLMHLRCSCYQILFLERVPDYAVINEAVEIAKQMFTEKTAGFVNGLLRNLVRQKHKIVFPKELKKSLCVTYSYPEWLVGYFLDNFGQDQTLRMFKYFAKPAPIYLRIKKENLKQVLKELNEKNICFKNIEKYPNVLQIDLSQDISLLESFKKGFIYVQDIHALDVVHKLDLQEKDIILDACAAPGGKTTYMAEITAKPENIVAVDNSKIRLKKLKQNLNRLGLNDVNIICADMTEKGQIKQKFDKILLDVPCSNLGVIGRRVDVKWRLNKEDILKLSKEQKKILENAYSLLNKNGIMVYSTCTLTKEENQDNIQSFLKDKADLVLEYEYCNYPSEDTGDGGYIARIRKI